MDNALLISVEMEVPAQLIWILIDVTVQMATRENIAKVRSGLCEGRPSLCIIALLGLGCTKY